MFRGRVFSVNFTVYSCGDDEKAFVGRSETVVLMVWVNEKMKRVPYSRSAANVRRLVRVI